MKSRYNRHKVSYQRKLRYYRKRRDEARDLFVLALMEIADGRKIMSVKDAIKALEF